MKLVGDRLRSAVHRVIGPPGEQAQSPRHSVVYFSRPNGDIKLASLLDNEDQEEAVTADEWIANRVKLVSPSQSYFSLKEGMLCARHLPWLCLVACKRYLKAASPCRRSFCRALANDYLNLQRRTANYKGQETFNASRGTEHLKERGQATLDRPAKVVEPV